MENSESEGSSDEDDEDKRDMEGKTYSAAGEEVKCFFGRVEGGNVMLEVQITFEADG
jgi:hypothetical protein